MFLLHLVLLHISVWVWFVYLFELAVPVLVSAMFMDVTQLLSYSFYSVYPEFQAYFLPWLVSQDSIGADLFMLINDQHIQPVILHR